MSGPRILVIDDEEEIRGLLRDILADEGYTVEIAADAAQARTARAGQDPDLILLDIWMPDTDGITLLREWSQPPGLSCPVVIMSGHGTVETAVEATRLGAFDFIEKPLSLAKLLRTVEKALESGRQKRQGARLLIAPVVAPVGRSRVMQGLREQVQRLAPHDTPVLILGESGSGREVVARYLHAVSPRASQPFVQLLPASVSDENAAAELHGIEDASGVRRGILDHAQGGVLFIKGLEDLTPSMQRLLLADLNAKSYTRVGGHQTIPLNVRLLSSAEPGFEVGVNSEFRTDLLSRLNAITLSVPPLRNYAEDVPELLRYHIDRLVDEEQLPLRHFSVAAQNRLRNYPWPGNVAELRNLVRRLLILGGSEEIQLSEVERQLSAATPTDEPLVKQDLLALPLREAREQFERAYLHQQLILCNGKVGQLAKRVGMERTHLYRKLRSLGVDFRQLADD